MSSVSEGRSNSKGLGDKVESVKKRAVESLGSMKWSLKNMVTGMVLHDFRNNISNEKHQLNTLKQF